MGARQREPVFGAMLIVAISLSMAGMSVDCFREYGADLWSFIVALSAVWMTINVGISVYRDRIAR
jgi:hypothetical protein